MNKNLAPETLAFIRDLQQNNQREWFQENKDRYESAKSDFLEFMQDLINEAADFEPALETQQAKDVVFRIYRDVRFSANKAPYKDHFGAYLAEGGRKTINPGYYLHIAPDNHSFLACGLWLPPAPELKAVRQEIDYNLDELKRILEEPKFRKIFSELEGEKLKTTPKGYDAENPAIEFLRHKSWMVSHQLPDELLVSDKGLDTILKLMQTGKPFIDFLIRPLHDVSENKEV